MEIPQKGLNLDTSSYQVGSYPFAFNTQIQSFTDEASFPYLSNTPSNTLCYSLLDEEEVIGNISIYELSIFILFIKGNNYNKIVYLKDCIATTMVESNCLNFVSNINAVYKLTDETLNLYFVDGINEDRIIQFHRDSLLLLDEYKVNYVENCIITFNTELDCNKTKFYPELSFPCLSTSIINGGNKKNGMYEYTMCYSTSNGEELSSYMAITSPIHIFDIEKEEINKSIKITIDDLNGARWKYVKIIGIETVKEITSYHVKVILPILNSTITFIDDEMGGTSISSSSIFAKFPYYKTSKIIAKANNILLKANLKEYDKFNLQSAVNKIELEWVSGKLKLGDYKDGEISSKYRGYLRDEVYTFGVKFILDNLEETPTYILSSRTAVAYDKEIINNADGFGERWEVYNTAQLISTPNENYNSGECISIYQTGKFAYWESSVSYPNNFEVWGGLCGQKIRHFKFPDNSTSPHFKGEYIHPLGVKLSDDTNISEILNDAVKEGKITQEQRNRIRGWKLVRGNRANNKSIIAKGILYDMWNYEKPLSEGDCNGIETQKYYYSSYPFNDLRDDNLLSSTKNHYDYNLFEADLQTITPQKFVNENKYMFHSPDTSFVNPTIGNTLVLEGEINGTSRGWFSESENQAKQKLLTKKHYELAFLYGKFIADTSDNGDWEKGSSIGTSVGGSLGASAGIPGIGSALGGLLGGVIGSTFAKYSLSNYIYKSTIQLNQAERLLTLLKLAGGESVNYNYQYQAIGNYSNFVSKVGDGKKIREIKNSGYIKGDKTNVNGTLINNLYKESGVYLDTFSDNLLNSPDTEDVSRFDLSTKSTNETLNCYSWYENRFTSPFELQITYYNGEVLSVTNSQYFDENGAAIVDDSGGDINYYLNYCSAVSYEFKSGAGNITITTTVDGGTSTDCNCANTYKSVISSWYGTIKNKIDSQYNSVFDIEWIDVNSCVTNIAKISDNIITFGDIDVSCISTPCKDVYFGGDTFIGNFSFKRKHHFWLNTSYNLPDGTDIYYTDLANIAYPTYFYNTQYVSVGLLRDSIDYPFNTGSSDGDKHRWWGNVITGWKPSGMTNGILSVKNFLKPPNFYLDCYTSSSTKFNFKPVLGKQYTYYFGIVNVIVESDINLDVRQYKDNLEGDFYPHQSDVKFWLQEKNVSPKLDNTYYYDRTFSKQATKGFNYINDVNFRGNELNKITHPTSIIYSASSNEIDRNDVRDNFTIFKALDVHDFSLSNGELKFLKEIEGNKVIVGFENQLQMFNAYIEINTNADTALISVGNLFKQKPVEFNKSDIPYLGTSHNIINSTPYGHVFLNSTSGQIFLLGNNGGGLSEISNKGVKHWMKNNLPFNILKVNRNINIDNNTIGISVCFDKRFDMLYITKRDYLAKKEIKYLNEKYYFGEEEVFLTDKTYFEDVSWTIGWSFIIGSWIGWYGFVPNLYLEGVHEYYSGIKGGIWKHNVEGHYQEFYGKTSPFIIEMNTKPELIYKLFKSCKYYLDVIEYKNKNKHYIQNKGFNKAIIYNEHQNSGLLELEYKDKNKITNKFPKYEDNKSLLSYSKVENEYRFNGFIDRSSGGWQWLFSGNNVSKRLNKNNLNNKMYNNYIRGESNYIRLISDDSNLHFIFKGLVDDVIPSIT